VGTLGYGSGDDPDDAAKQLISNQRIAGYGVLENMILVGFPLGKIRDNNSDWTKLQLPDGREIGIASTEDKKIIEVAREFLLAEVRAGRLFNDQDVISFQNVSVKFLNWFDQSPLATPPWLRKQREWTWPLIALALGLGLFIAMRALGWVVDGFVNSRSEA